MKLINVKFVCMMFLFITVLASCDTSNKSAALLQQATKIIEENPKQALALLDSIREPETMDKDNYMIYIVANVQAKYKNYKDVTNDTLIFEAQKYFRDKSDYNQAALAHYYAGIVYHERKDNENKLRAYLNAKQSSIDADYDVIIAKSSHALAQIYRDQKLDSLAIVNYKTALHYYDKIEGVEGYQVQVLRFLGITYSTMNELDSARQYFEKGFYFSLENEDKYYQMQFYMDLGILQQWEKNYNDAVVKLNQALALTTTKADSTRVYLNLAIVYNSTHQLDSAKYYTDFVVSGLPTIKDKKTLRTIYGALADYNTQIGNLTEAQRYSDLKHEVNRQILDANSADKLLEVTKQHQQELQKKDEKVADAQTIAIIAILALIIIVLLVIVYIKYKKKRTQIQLAIDRNKRLEAEKESQDTKAKSILALQTLSNETVSEWVEIDKDVDKLAEKLGAKTKPDIYLRIEKMVKDLKSKTEEQRIQWAADYLAKHKKIDQKLIKGLNPQMQLLLVLCCCRHSKQDIASILSISEKKVYPLKLELKHKMKAVEMKDKDIEKILFSDPKM